MSLPVHPMLVHFPIALYFLELLLILFWVFKKDENFRGFSIFTFRTAFLGLLAAAVAGWLDSGGWKNIGGELAEHFYGAVSLAIIQITRGLYWQFGKPQGSKGARVCLITSLIGCAAIVYTALHGGELVYHTD